MTDLNLDSYFSLSISHNQHKNYYQKLADYIASEGTDRYAELTDEEYDSCIASDEFWEIQVYPRTPISFHFVCGSTLEGCLVKMKKELND